MKIEIAYMQEIEPFEKLLEKLGIYIAAEVPTDKGTIIYDLYEAVDAFTFYRLGLLHLQIKLGLGLVP